MTTPSKEQRFAFGTIATPKTRRGFFAKTFSQFIR
jgi:hypothetical protein